MSKRLEHGWLTDGGFVCDGCGVRDGWEHRCCRDDGVWADARQVCVCSEPGCFGDVGSPSAFLDLLRERGEL